MIDSHDIFLSELHKTGAVNSLRLPLGDFMYKPYGPYRKHCQNPPSLVLEKAVPVYLTLHFSLLSRWMRGWIFGLCGKVT